MTPAVSDHYRDVISKAPGPAPWYLREVASDLSTQQVKLTWEKGLNSGPTELIDSNRLIYALASMSCYVRTIRTTQFVVWYKAGIPGLSEIHFELYEKSALRPMTDEQLSSARLNKRPFATAATLLAEFSISQSQSVGLRNVQLPVQFADSPELFVLVSNGNTWDNVGLQLWSITPSLHQMNVTSQDWFTNGNYDFGYQWITRVARSPETGNLVGDGIRIGPFILNEDGSKFLQWLGEEDFPNKDLSIGNSS